MRQIPKELQAYFPEAPYPNRPWWKTTHDGECMERSNPNWSRTIRVDRLPFGATVEELLRENDHEAPLPPPPILVGQVWGAPTSDAGCFYISSVVAIEMRADGSLRVDWAGQRPTCPMLDPYKHGFLLVCPFGYAPWSGPEVP